MSQVPSATSSSGGTGSGAGGRHLAIPFRLPFWVLFIAGAGFSAWQWRSQVDVVISAGAAAFVGLLALIATADLLLMLINSRRYVEWHKAEPLSEGWDALRTSLMAIAFFYGVILGHFVWE